MVLDRSNISFEEILSLAREHFQNSKYTQAEPLLNQLILQNRKSPEIFQMLGTIYYDQGKFNKAIRSFQRALELDPGYTDASIGLSIILNDLGKYEDGQKIFEEAQSQLSKKGANRDPLIEEKLAIKHDELGEMYLQFKRIKEAKEQFFKALNLSTRKAELSMKIVECNLRLGQTDLAMKDLRNLIRDYPNYYGARLKLGKILYDLHRVAEAVEQWENVLKRDPTNAIAKSYLQLGNAVGITQLENMRL